MTQELGLALLAEVSEGDKVMHMLGSKESLVSRAAHVIRDALTVSNYSNQHILGGLLLYSAHCRRSVGTGMRSVHQSVNSMMGNAPYLTAFTFGEQGRLLDSDVQHSNLLISAILFVKQSNELKVQVR